MYANSYCCDFAPRKSLNSLVFDPCGNVPEKGDFLTKMQQNAENLLAIWSHGTSMMASETKPEPQGSTAYSTS